MKKKSLQSKSQSTWIIASVAAVAFFVLLGKSGWTSAQKPRVLGINQLLADKGGDSGGGGHDSGGGGDHGGGGNSGGGGSSGGGSSGGGGGSSGGSGDHGDSDRGASGSSGGDSGASANVDSNATVDCVGPDGRHSRATLGSCSNFNKAWNNPNFSFTVVETPKPLPPSPQLSPSPEKEKEKPERLEVKTREKTKINLGASGVRVEVETENGKLKVKAKKADETEVELENENEALEHVNEELKKDDVHIGTAAAGFTLKRGEVEAETHFPLSVNVATHELTVTTPAGVKVVTVLPDQAVQNLLSRNIFDRIERNVASPGAQKVELTQVENQPVFVVKGIDDKRFLGFIPVVVRKTAFVSAQNGGIVRTDEDLFNRALDVLSF